MKNRFLFSILIIAVGITLYFGLNSYAFTRIEDLIFDGVSVEPDKLQEVLDTIKLNKIKNKKNPKKLKPTKLITIQAKQKDPKNIQLEIDTSGLVAKNEKDIQAAISNQGFLDAISEAVNLWDNVDIATVGFKPLKFASGQVNPEDGKNIISFRAVEEIDGVAEGAPIVSIITYARTNTVIFMGKPIMVQPGTILDADAIYDPTNDPCLALHTTVGSFKIGGDDVEIAEGGVDPEADTSSCKFITGSDITDLAVQTIGSILGLDSSPTASAATSSVALIMTRYALTNDDKIGLANIYPNKKNLTNHGIISGKVTLNKKPVRGAHVVLEDVMTSEPVASTVSNINGTFTIKAVPAGTYNAYAEPLDGPVRKNAIPRNFFGFTSQQNFSTGVFPVPVIIKANKITRINIEVKELSASAFNINHLTIVLTEADVNEAGGSFILPIKIMPGETLTSIPFWGSNISTDFGTLSVSGSGITISNVVDASIPISPFVECSECTDSESTMCTRDPRCPPTHEITNEPDRIQGITADITCNPSVSPGPRNIIFTGDQLDITHPSFGLRDQITGGLVVVE